ncbi:7823_t:CDS:2 [Cetraspora pellucida]|uniref:7823_t:CDS:1 n=1 Tax=Cetraspora pellucida TaxID=1433469 RepID=A0A9N9HLA5_9GLOM|nr:7823_t:CDS:2 [Cetraspora pellucida]
MGDKIFELEKLLMMATFVVVGVISLPEIYDSETLFSLVQNNICLSSTSDSLGTIHQK